MNQRVLHYLKQVISLERAVQPGKVGGNAYGNENQGYPCVRQGVEEVPPFCSAQTGKTP